MAGQTLIADPESRTDSQPAAATYAIGGTVSGLGKGRALVLQNKAGDDLKIEADGAFVFPAAVSQGADYAVTVRTQPLWQFCTVNQGTGTTDAEVRTVTVACAAASAQVTTLSGFSAAGSSDGGGAVSFGHLTDIAVDASGNLYVAESFNHRIRKVTPAGEVTTLAGSGIAGSADGRGNAASFNRPFGVAVDAGGTVYVADTGNNLIRKITPGGEVTTLAGNGTVGDLDGAGVAASFSRPGRIAVDTGGNVYAVDTGNNLVRKITPAGEVSTLLNPGLPGLGGGAGDQTAAAGGGIAVDASGNVYVNFDGYDNLLKITPAGEATQLQCPDSGQGIRASCRSIADIAVDSNGNIYMADFIEKSILALTPAGEYVMLAGPETAGNDRPLGIAVDGGGNVYVTKLVDRLIQKIVPTAP